MSTISVRERHPIPQLGQLHVVVRAKQGFSMCPTTQSVVSAIGGAFSSFIRDNAESHQLHCPERGIKAQAIAYAIDWQDVMQRQPQIKSWHVDRSEGGLTFTIEFAKPITRLRGTPDAADCRASFSLGWQPSGGEVKSI